MLKKFAILLGVLIIVALAAAQDDEPFALTIMHTNDTHSHHTPEGDGNGGAAIQKAVVDQIRAQVDNSLLLDGGDRFTGTLFHQQYRGEDSIQIMNLMGYDAMTLGNHEFDDGEDVLLNFVSGLDFPVVTANVDFSAFPELDEIIEPAVVLEVGGEQIGVIGLVTPETPLLSKASADLAFDDNLAGVVAAAIEELEAAGVNKIIVVAHVGFNTAALSEMDGVDIVVDGHNTILLSNAYTEGVAEYPIEGSTGREEPILYVQAGGSTNYLGRLDVEFDANGVIADYDGDTILLSGYITPDEEMADLIAELEGPLEELRATPIGADAAFLLDGDRVVCRIEECHLGDLIADALLWETGADIAFQNGGGIRADIDEGEITLGEVLTVLPFGNLTSTFELSGADVVAALENGVSTVVVGEDGVVARDDLAGRFPQVAGLRFTFNPTQEVGSRVTSVEVMDDQGEFAPIDESATYFVAANDFMRGGGDGYEMFAANAVNPYDFGRPLDEVLAEYLAQLSAVEPTNDGRITMEGAELAPRG